MARVADQTQKEEDHATRHDRDAKTDERDERERVKRKQRQELQEKTGGDDQTGAPELWLPWFEFRVWIAFNSGQNFASLRSPTS